jgi:hypothetical protein
METISTINGLRERAARTADESGTDAAFWS